MPASKAQQKAVNKYVKANYDLYQVKMPKGRKDEIKAHAEAQGQSVNGFINAAIDHEMERDNAGGPQEVAQEPSGSGVVPLRPDTLEAAERAAEATGEAVPDFMRRAVETQAQRDKASLKLGINPTTGGRLEKEA